MQAKYSYEYDAQRQELIKSCDPLARLQAITEKDLLCQPLLLYNH